MSIGFRPLNALCVFMYVFGVLHVMWIIYMVGCI